MALIIHMNNEQKPAKAAFRSLFIIHNSSFFFLAPASSIVNEEKPDTIPARGY